MSEFEKKDPIQEAFNDTAEKLNIALEGAPTEIFEAHESDLGLDNYLDLRRLYPDLPKYAEYRVAAELEEDNPAIPILRKVIEEVLDFKRKERIPSYEISVPRPFYIYDSEVSAEINEALGTAKSAIRKRAYEGKITIDGVTYSFSFDNPVYTIGEQLTYDDTQPTQILWYEFAPSTPYLAEGSADDELGEVDTRITDSEFYHLNRIEEVAKRIIDN